MLNNLTQEQLKEQLSYDPDTGIFTRNKNGTTYRKGDVIDNTSTTGYTRVMVTGTRYLAHRLAWLYVYNIWPEHDIDHINHIRNDNRINNLRCATRKENGKNRSMRNDNTSGTVGISWHNRDHKWQAYINASSGKVFLGYFSNKDDAIKAREKALTKCNYHKNHGENINA